MLEDDNKVRIKYKDGEEVKLPNKGLQALAKEAPEVVERMLAQEGGSMDDQMMKAMEQPDMMPDEEMENNYTKFIMEEALNEEEEDMLTSKLEQDKELQNVI